MDIEFEGQKHSFPDDATSQEIVAAMVQQTIAPTNQPITSKDQLTGSFAEQMRFGKAATRNLGFDPTGANIPGWIKRAAIPTAAALATAPFTAGMSIPAAIAIETGVGAASELANQGLGISEPSKANVAISAAMGPLGRLGTAGFKGITRAGAMAFGGRELVGEAAGSAIAARLLPGKTAAQLFAELPKDIPISFSKTISTIDDVLKTEMGQAQSPIKAAIMEVADSIKTFSTSEGKNAATVLEEAQRLRELASGATGKVQKAIYNIRNSLLNDLETAGSAAKEAGTRYRKEQAVATLQDILMKPSPLKNLNEKLTDDSLFAGAFSEAEKTEIKSLARRMLLVIPSGWRGPFSTTAIGTGGTMATGSLPEGAAIASIPHIVAAALATAPGRKFLEQLMVGRPGLDAPRAAALMQFMRAYLGENLAPGKLEGNQ